MKNILLICLLFIGTQAYSQIHIQLLDKGNGLPVSFAHYVYGNQKGSANIDGEIELKFTEEQNLLLSHVNYGKQSFSPNQLLNAKKEGKLYLQKAYVSLMPATVIARRNKKADSEVMQVQNSDKLSHDAGDFLSQTAIIGGIRKSGSYGFDPVLRGFKYDQINIVMDNGISATAACPNRMDPPISQIPLNMVDQVEILKGPHSLRYGSSFGGSIHFTSSPARFTKNTKAFGRANASYESNGNIFRTEAQAGAKGKFYNFGIYGAFSNGSDYKDGNGDKVASSFNRRNIGLDAAFKLSEMQSLKLSANNNFAEDVDFPALNMDLREDDTWLFNVQHKIHFKNSSLASLSSSAYGSFVDHEMDNLEKNLNPRKVNAITKAETKNYGFRSEAAFQFSNSSLFTGIDYKSEQADGNRTREMLMGPMAGKIITDKIWQDSKIDKLGLFGEYHFSIDEIYFVASSRLEHNSAESYDKADNFISIDPGNPSNDLNISASIGATYDLSKQVRIGLWAGRAARSASLTERFINHIPVDVDPYERVGNPDLDPEVNYQLDFNFNWITKNTELGITLFASHLRDYISSRIRTDLSPLMPTAPGVKQFVNINKAVMRGFEITFNQKLSSSFYHRIMMAYTYGKDKDFNQALPEIPPLDFRYSLGAKLCKNKFQPEINFRHVLKQNRVAENFGETETPSFSLLDLKANYFLSDNVSIIGGVKNILDETYYEHLNRSVKGTAMKPIYAPGRSFYLTLSVNL